MNQHFFEKYNINPLSFDRCGLKWDDLQAISDHYDGIKKDLEAEGKYAVEKILKCSHVHSINYRIKDNEHLLEKIIRKVTADPERSITIDNYRSEITDLVGIRVLHLFKEDWSNIHRFMNDSWDFAEQPKAYVRHGDSKRIMQFYKENNCLIEEHPYGYRSVHYLIETGAGKEKVKVEAQVRTIFEEAWGEIDHVVRYPYHLDNDMLVRLSSILNRLAGDADELGTYMRYLKNQTDEANQIYKREIESKNKVIDDLKKQIDALQIDKQQKETLTSSLGTLEEGTKPAKDANPDFLWLDSFIDTPFFKSISSRIEEIVQSNGFDPIEISEKDFEIMGKAQKELFQMLGDPSKMNQLLSDQHVKQLMDQIEAAPPLEKVDPENQDS